jgi:hypothetical protein
VPSHGPPPAQIEIILNFFIGFHESGCYYDSLPAIARRYLTAIGKFTFDVLTSIPLSYIDIYFSKVRRRRSFLVSESVHGPFARIEGTLAFLCIQARKPCASAPPVVNVSRRSSAKPVLSSSSAARVDSPPTSSYPSQLRKIIRQFFTCHSWR